MLERRIVVVEQGGAPMLRVTVGVMVALTTAVPASAVAQFPPDSLRNLKVFPQDMSPRELIGIMRSFAFGLGVRCQFCHVGEEGQPLEEFDFVSDDKSTKRKARQMLEMVRAINERHLDSLEDRSEPPVIVTCETCHRGVSKPRRIQDILLAQYRDKGIAAAIGEYRTLRQQFYGGFAYDFSEWMLTGLGGDLVRAAGQADSDARSQRLAAAVALLDLNLEYYPESAFTHFTLGEAHRLRGDTAAAIAGYERSLELMPENRVARERLQQLRGH